MASSALAVIGAALARGVAPVPVIKPAAWAKENLVLADGPQAGHKWSPATTPYAVDILNALAAESPHTRVSVRKSAQTGLTQVGLAWLGSIMDKTPARAMVVFPTISLVQDFNRDKLTPTIEETPALRRKVSEVKRRSGRSSTIMNKVFPGGSLTLAGANSSADLRSKTVKYLFCDEVDDWPHDLDGQGDPMEMAAARQTAFHATGDYKRYEASTPLIKGSSRIDEAFESGDQRYWHVPCPHCGEFQRLVFGGKDKPWGLKFNTEFPYAAHYVCCHCGGVIEHYQKRAMVQAGRWVAEAPGAGRHPSFHIDALSSLLTTWDHVAKAFLASKDDPAKLKTFTNLWLGEAWEERGDAPEWSRLYARREARPRRLIPPGGLILTAAADVQRDGVFYEVTAWGPGERSWTIDCGFLLGDTGAADTPVWRALAGVFLGEYPDSYGNQRRIDLAGVDSGFNTEAVYGFARAHSGVLALKGVDGWSRPALGTAQQQDVTWKGAKKRRGLKVWQVGTWGLKAKFYAYLRREGLREGAGEDPPGYCYFAEFQDEQYFKQLTNEYLGEVKSKGRVRREWIERGANHYLDCRIYNMALAAHPLLAVPDLTDDNWRALARERAVPSDGAQGDIEALLLRVAPSAGQPEPGETTEQTTTPEPPRQRRGGWLSNRDRSWI